MGKVFMPIPGERVVPIAEMRAATCTIQKSYSVRKPLSSTADTSRAQGCAGAPLRRSLGSRATTCCRCPPFFVEQCPEPVLRYERSDGRFCLYHIVRLYLFLPDRRLRSNDGLAREAKRSRASGNGSDNVLSLVRALAHVPHCGSTLRAFKMPPWRFVCVHDKAFGVHLFHA